MREPFIFVDMNLFTLKYKVLICGNFGTQTFGSFTIEELPEAIVEFAQQEEVYLVKLQGAGKYSQLIEYEINSIENLKYHERKIQIEVI